MRLAIAISVYVLFISTLTASTYASDGNVNPSIEGEEEKPIVGTPPFPSTFKKWLQSQMFIEGVIYRTADNWFTTIPLWSAPTPIKYLEIGTFYGANLFSVALTYAAHPQSRLYCIDPWVDYEDYPEYKDRAYTQVESIYATFLSNLDGSGFKDKVTVIRGYSHQEVPKFEDDFFDIIYIDGNHEPEYVMEDAVLSFRKLKVGGFMVFDDYLWGGPDLTTLGIDGFLRSYHKRLSSEKTLVNYQIIVQKIR